MLLVMLASSTSGDQHFFLFSLHCADHHPHMIWGELERLVIVPPVMTTSWDLSWSQGKQLTGERLRETAET
jgi:hypothetical protein